MTEAPTAFGAYEVVRTDAEAIEVSALGPLQSGSSTGFSHHGVLGAGLDVEDGRAAAARCAIAVRAALEANLGDLVRVAAVRRVRVFVATTSDFRDHAIVADAASEVFHEAFGASGAHARTVVGVASLPFNVPVVVEMTARANLAAVSEP